MADANYEHEIYTLTDENGIDKDFELLDVLEKDDEVYYALIPYCENAEDFCEEDELVILKRLGEELVSVTEDDEFNEIADIFIERFSEEE